MGGFGLVGGHAACWWRLSTMMRRSPRLVGKTPWFQKTFPVAKSDLLRDVALSLRDHRAGILRWIVDPAKDTFGSQRRSPQKGSHAATPFYPCARGAGRARRSDRPPRSRSNDPRPRRRDRDLLLRPDKPWSRISPVFWHTGGDSRSALRRPERGRAARRGIVQHARPHFDSVISKNGKSGPAFFLFVTNDAMPDEEQTIPRNHYWQPGCRHDSGRDRPAQCRRKLAPHHVGEDLRVAAATPWASPKPGSSERPASPRLEPRRHDSVLPRAHDQLEVGAA